MSEPGLGEPGRPPAIDPRRLAGLSARPAPPNGPGDPAPAAATPGYGPPGQEPAGRGPVGRGPDGSEPDGDREAADAGSAGADQAVPLAEDSTGHAEVDAALAELARAERLPPREQVSAYESVHRTLQDTLRSIEQG
jgi:hypothetical protein